MKKLLIGVRRLNEKRAEEAGMEDVPKRTPQQRASQLLTRLASSSIAATHKGGERFVLEAFINIVIALDSFGSSHPRL